MNNPGLLYALDTNTLIYFFKGLGQVAENLLSHPPADIAIPTLVVYEIETGLAKSNQSRTRRQQFDQLLQAVNVLPFDLDAARAAAKLRAQLEKSGTPIGPLDTLIAGVAIARRATLITHNTRELSRINELQLADWF